MEKKETVYMNKEEASSLFQELAEKQHLKEFLKKNGSTIPTTMAAVCFSKYLGREVTLFEVTKLMDDLLAEIEGTKEAPLPGRVAAYRGILDLKEYFGAYYKRHTSLGGAKLTREQRAELFLEMWKIVGENIANAELSQEQKNIVRIAQLKRGNSQRKEIEKIASAYKEQFLRVVKNFSLMKPFVPKEGVDSKE